MNPSDQQRLPRRLRRWYREHGRHELPWRLTRDRYAVLVSEVMLQQTQVDRVLRYWVAWIERWPDVAALADAPTAEVIRAWSGLGYNRRAVNLQRAAREAADRWGGLPGDPDLLVTMPGIGRYTASAVACFADGRRVAVLDTNVARVIARAFMGAGSGRAVRPAVLQEAALELLPARGARDWNLALMDLGATVCTAKRPACTLCPFSRECAWQLAGYPGAEQPVATTPSPKFEETARFARGRIVELLREQGPSSLDGITEALPAIHRGRAALYIASLERDGLAEGLDNGSTTPTRTSIPRRRSR